MAYDLNRTNGNLLITLNEKTIDNTSSPIKFVGRKVTSYGEVENERALHMLENFANTTEPTTPLVGMTWYDTTESKLKVCFTEVGLNKWKTISIINTTAPVPPVVGDTWYDTGDNKFKVWTGSEWLTIGPIDPSSYDFIINTSATTTGLNPADVLIAMPDNMVVQYDIKILAKDVTTSIDVGSWKINGCLYRTLAGAATFVDVPNYQVIGRNGVAETGDWDVTADVSGINLKITVDGVNGANTINWKIITELYKL